MVANRRGAAPGRDEPAAWPSWRRRRAALAVAAVVTLVGGASLAACSPAPRHPTHATTALLAPFPGSLQHVAPISATSTWAVGTRFATGRSAATTSAVDDRTLILRWDGSSWSRAASPNPGRAAELFSVSAGPGGSAWAAGYSCVSGCGTASEVDRTLILRWDGSSWSRAASPSPGRSAWLDGVSAGPGGSAWAAGWSCVSGCGTASEVDRTLILRWDGRSWSRAASPSPGRVAGLDGVSAGPGGSAWAAGRSCVSGCFTASEVDRTLILRWDGGSWSRAASPSPGRTAQLVSVSAGPGGSAWAAGRSCVSGCGTASAVVRTLILRWHGGSWSRAASPSPGRTAVLWGVSAGPGGSAWASGFSCVSGCGTASAVDRTLILRWHGGSWSRAASPSPGRGADLVSVSAGPGGSAWAAGFSCVSGCFTASEVDRTLILRWDGTGWVAG
jgi:hypothetical protein